MDAFSFWRGELPYVFLNAMKSAERSRMDDAHELGHLVLHWRGGARGRDAEREADLFGAAFLMPRDSVIAGVTRGARLRDIIKSKSQWKVSVTNLTYRMHTVGLLSDWEYRSRFIEISKKGYRTSEPRPVQPENSQALEKVFNQLRQEGVSHGDVARELCIPPDELSKLIFGLVLTPVGTEPRGDQRPSNPPTRSRLRLV